MVRLTDRPDMTLDVHRGRKTTLQQQHTPNLQHEITIMIIHVNTGHMCTVNYSERPRM